ncbi:hypothetical protein [Microbacterium terricola]|uniref:Uncharacterized protein n=1 Tax=Microbacterium terricola TaxID=344163 RepID=A0ABM8DYV6_9MICO|nr:hypothetical protein [Microbacterium terricola]UYK41474.1 hypothetical protein OAU46_07560 [Microbacterium terricola]BDV30736.1 hypothetical protein Microterr_13960 [Microbacterium terricola]
MSTPDQPDNPPLTRKQLRELRQTGAVPVISPDDGGAAPDEPAATPENPPPAPLARAAEPVELPPAPVPDEAVDLGISPLTRRQARQQEKIRTASVPVITPEVAAAHTAQFAAPESEPETSSETETASETETSSETDTDSSEILEAEVDETSPEEAEPAQAELEADEEPAAAEELVEESAPEPEAQEEVVDRPLVHPELGAELLAGEPASVDLPPSFDQLLARSATGSMAATNALILSQTPAGAGASIVAPVTATGEILITGTLNLPEGLGSTGHAHGTADGKEVDAVLVDGELPAHSSPTPIAASAAISTVKSAGEIIQPPAPEKGSKLMLTLAITAGVLAVALVGVLIVAIVTGVFQ